MEGMRVERLEALLVGTEKFQIQIQIQAQNPAMDLVGYCRQKVPAAGLAPRI